VRVVVEADGGSRGNPGPAGYGAVVRDASTGRVLAERAASIGTATNNVAEYGGLIAGLEAARDLGADEVDVRLDSKLVVEQMSGRWKVKHPAMQPLHREASELRSSFARVRFRWIPRAENAHADRLANEAMDAAARGETWQVDSAEEWLGRNDPARRGDAATETVSEPEPAASLHDAAPNRLSGWQEAPGRPTTTLLLRHGQTALSVQKRFSGVGDPELTDVGRQMAAAAAVRLAGSGADAVVTSPLRRARETADLVAEALGVEVDIEEGLRETDFGDWDGHTFAEVREKWPDELDAWLGSTAVAPPAGESFDATADRVRSALRRVQRAYAGRTVVVVSHVTPIKTLLRIALDAPPSALYRMHLDLVSLSEVQWFPDGPAVVRSMNDTQHHAPPA
jgi:ribonuclease H / adenosylcobalamin/alpha-ribazole phosphatase